uniref:Copper-fist domain-containing protein n=1 Tax=Moniliophthora roreri TaxID=221103 RepID=A0A0W0F0Y9_MONRR
MNPWYSTRSPEAKHRTFRVGGKNLKGLVYSRTEKRRCKVLISDKKYACETCIKGHRSSSCKHTDRPLFEIKKKGRPITQCEHCRELRKTKQVHVKCVCIKSETSSKAIRSLPVHIVFRLGSNKTLESAAFPNGLPEALEASVALQLLSEGTSSDSDHSNGCSHHRGGDCECFAVRKRARSRKKEASGSGPMSGVTTSPNPNGTSPSQLPLASHPALSRVQEFRPVLPKPSPRRFDHEGPFHEASSSSRHGHGSGRHHVHDSFLFSPYSRAYDYTHQAYVGDPRAVASSPDLLLDTNFNSLSSSQRRVATEVTGSWSQFQSNEDLTGSLCGFIDGCVCHSNEKCRCFINCIVLESSSLPDALPPNTALSIHGNMPRGYPGEASVDEWTRQLDLFQSQPGSAAASPSYGGYPQEFQQLDTYFSQPSSTEVLDDYTRSNLVFTVPGDRSPSGGEVTEHRRSPFDSSPVEYDSSAAIDQRNGFIPVPVMDQGVSAMEIGRSRSSSSSSSSASGSSRFSIPPMSRLSLGQGSASSRTSSFSSHGEQRRNL